MALKTNSRLYNIRPLVVGKARELVQMHAKVDRSLPPGAIRESFPDQWNGINAGEELVQVFPVMPYPLMKKIQECLTLVQPASAAIRPQIDYRAGMVQSRPYPLYFKGKGL